MREQSSTSCIQEPGETVDTFITALYSLAEHCDYKDLHDDLIRDRIVVGIRDARLSEKMQLDAKLTLATAIDTVRQSEAVKQQQSTLRSNGPETPVNAVQKSKTGN